MTSSTAPALQPIQPMAYTFAHQSLHSTGEQPFCPGRGWMWGFVHRDEHFRLVLQQLVLF